MVLLEEFDHLPLVLPEQTFRHEVADPQLLDDIDKITLSNHMINCVLMDLKLVFLRLTCTSTEAHLIFK